MKDNKVLYTLSVTVATLTICYLSTIIALTGR